MAKSTPDVVCEIDELMAPPDWAAVPSKSTTIRSPSTVTATRTSNERSETPSVSMVNDPR